MTFHVLALMLVIGTLDVDHEHHWVGYRDVNTAEVSDEDDGYGRADETAHPVRQLNGKWQGCGDVWRLGRCSDMA